MLLSERFDFELSEIMKFSYKPVVHNLQKPQAAFPVSMFVSLINYRENSDARLLTLRWPQHE